MTTPGDPIDSSTEGTGRPSAVRVVAIGCFMAWIGAFSGAMIGVLASKVAAWFGKMPPCEGIPSCDWYIYAAVGGVIGAISLPWLVVMALLRSGKDAAPGND